jgi:hypothetical protein
MKAGANDPVKIASLGIEAFERDFAVLGASSPPEQAGTARLLYRANQEGVSC